MSEIHEDLERVFGPWLRLSKDDEVVTLLRLVERELRRRGYTVEISVQPPAPRSPLL